MTHIKFSALQTARWLLLLAAATGLSAQAAGRASEARYQQDRAACLAGQSQQDRATCLKEAGAALAEARRGGLNSDASTYSAHQRERCERLSGDERHDCLARMQGRGSVSGSVAGGGILRELVTREVAAPAAGASAPAATPTPPASAAPPAR